MGSAEIIWGDEYQCPECGLRVIVISSFGAVMPDDPNYEVYEKEIEVEGRYD
jgi:hypothetical protein